jgi:signal-transduction protein with cAMP-binding, CBS, and nucleotidyltransferase domain
MSTRVEHLLAHKGNTIWSLEPDATVQDAVTLFGTHEIGAVLVCDKHGLIGILSERDCVQKILWQGRSTLASRVCDVMRGDVTAVSPHDSIEHCMALMTDRRTRHLPVMDRGNVIGVISIGDVINALLGEKESLIESLEGYISGSPSMRPHAH